LGAGHAVRGDAANAPQKCLHAQRADASLNARSQRSAELMQIEIEYCGM